MQKILYFLKTPPPFHGATLMNDYVNNNKLLKDNFEVRSIEIHYVNSVNSLGNFSFKKIRLIILVWLKLLYKLLFYRPDLVYFQISPLGAAFIRDFIFVLLIKTFNIKILFHLHGKGIYTASKSNKLFGILYKIAFKNNFIICLSKLLINDISSVYSDVPFIVGNGLENKTVTEIVQSNNKKPIILFISNIFQSKGIIDFLDSLQILNKRTIDFEAIIIGAEGDILKNELMDFINCRSLVSKTKYHGPLYGREKNEILKKSDVLVFPTHEDVWGLVILEAMQAGLPVISTYEGAIPEIVDDGKTGFLVEKQNPKALAEKMEILIKDKELRKKMGKAGRKKFLEKYTLEIFEKNMLKVFNDILYGE